MRQCIMCGRTFPAGTDICEFDGTTLFDVSGNEQSQTEDHEVAAKMGEFSDSLQTANAEDQAGSISGIQTAVVEPESQSLQDDSVLATPHPLDQGDYPDSPEAIAPRPPQSDTDRLVAGIEQEMGHLDETGSDSFAPLPLPITSDNIVTSPPPSTPMENASTVPATSHVAEDNNHGSSTTPITLFIVGLLIVSTIISIIYIVLISNPDTSQHPSAETQQTAPSGEATKTIEEGK